MKTEYSMTRNEAYNSLEISFTSKPSVETREALKALRFRWHGQKKVWYGYADEASVLAALEGKLSEAQPEAAKPAAPTKNRYGVQAGDLFYSSWGWEQTNVNWFQVIALVGESSVRVREVCPPVISDDACGPMSCDRTYKVDNTELLPQSAYTVFIKDQEKGDLKRLKSYAKDGVSEPLFTLSSFCNAYYVSPGTKKCYESWYA